MPIDPVTLLDTCAVVNLCASRHFREIVNWIAGDVCVVDVVNRETQFVQKGGAGDDRAEKEPVALAPLIEAGAVRLIDAFSDDELLTYIDLAIELDDGEALTAAVGFHRGWRVATDERKALRLMGERGMRTISSLELVRGWADAHALQPRQLRPVLEAIRDRGRYVPARSHPLRAWWDAAITW